MTGRMAYDVTDLIPDSLSAIYFARQDHRIDDSDSRCWWRRCW
jgi:hypothetical protein